MSKNQDNNKSNKNFKKLSPKTKERIRKKIEAAKHVNETRRKLGLDKTTGYIGGKTKSKLKKECKIICDKHLKEKTISLFLKQIDKKHRSAFKRGFNKTCKLACIKKAKTMAKQTRKNQRGGMPTIITNLGHSMGHSVSNL